MVEEAVSAIFVMLILSNLDELLWAMTTSAAATCEMWHTCSRLVGSLFYDAFSVTRLQSVDNRVISEWRIVKHFVGSDRDLILRYYSGIRLKGLNNTTKNLTQASMSPGPRFEPGPPEYEVGVLITQPRRSVGTSVVEGSVCLLFCTVIYWQPYFL
jgi:hypothetical protein